MALPSFLPATLSSTHHQTHTSRHGQGQSSHHKHKQQQQQRKKNKHPSPSPPKPPSSWEQLKSLLTCRIVGLSQVHDPSSTSAGGATKYTKLGSSCTYICALRDVVHGSSTRDHSPAADSCSSGSGPLGPETSLLAARSGSRHATARSGSTTTTTTTTFSSSSSRGGLQLRKLSGCYECHAISEPRRYPTPRTISSCPHCGEVFTKAESLELHQAIRHAVSELGPEDSGRNIVEIIFKSSWLKKDHPVCEIERILKVHNTSRTISRFEDYRDAVKSHATTSSSRQAAGKKNPRCAADGNELLRFHCTTLSCALGARGSTGLCSASSSSTSPCGVCTIIRHGFARARQETAGRGVRTTASSGRAHDYCCPGAGDDPAGGAGRRAMLVCRVIAGRVRRFGDEAAASPDEGGAGFDSVAGGGAYTNLEELFVASPRAILPCFVVVYRALG
uniref:C2H2-type domain-containing protein n=1 Tax=Anthurium amnicola TaxID=1678845 RepID=A0A1D1XSH2_9ARAE